MTAGPEPRSDEALMADYVAGDARAMRELFRRHAPKLTRVMAIPYLKILRLPRGPSAPR